MDGQIEDAELYVPAKDRSGDKGQAGHKDKVAPAPKQTVPGPSGTKKNAIRKLAQGDKQLCGAHDAA